MKNKVSLIALLSVLAMPILSGCVAAIGSHPRNTPTLGQQLLDLQKARDAGAISEQEYQATRAKFIAEK